jgi:hypothetical protein
MDTSRLTQLAGIDNDQYNVMEAVDIPENVSLEQIEQMLDAAKRGLGIANKLKKPSEKKKHASAVMSNLNKIRGALQGIINAL